MSQTLEFHADVHQKCQEVSHCLLNNYSFKSCVCKLRRNSHQVVSNSAEQITYSEWRFKIQELSIFTLKPVDVLTINESMAKLNDSHSLPSFF